MALFDENINTKINYCMEYFGGEKFADELMRALPTSQLEEIVDFIIQMNGIADVEDYE